MGGGEVGSRSPLVHVLLHIEKGETFFFWVYHGNLRYPPPRNKALLRGGTLNSHEYTEFVENDMIWSEFHKGFHSLEAEHWKHGLFGGRLGGLVAFFCFFHGFTLWESRAECCSPYLSYDWEICTYIHPGRLTWNLKITHLERKMIFQTSMIMFHVNLPGCITFCQPR